MAKQNYCCSAKQYFSYMRNLVDTLIIVPRIIICKKLKKNELFTQTVTIKNKGLYPRNLTYYTDSLQDTNITFPKYWEHTYLQPDEIFEIKVVIKPNAHSAHTNCRHIYIESAHPNITFEIPIVSKSMNECYLPKSIDFSSTTLDDSTYYEFLVYNPTKDVQTLFFRTYPKNIKITQSKTRIPPRDSIKVLLVLKVNNLNIMQDIIKIKIESVSSEIQIMHTPLINSFYINTNLLTFESLKYERETTRSFTVCNESNEDKTFTTTFFTDPEQLDENFDYKMDARQSQSYSIRSSSSFNMIHTPLTHPCDLVAYKHFRIDNEIFTIEGKSSMEISVIFHPVSLKECDFREEEPSPHKVRTILFLTIGEEMSMVRQLINFQGSIIGPEVEITPKDIYLRTVYMGEEHCTVIKVLNIDGKVNALVRFKDVYNFETAGAVVLPEEGFDLEPCKSGIFRISFFSKVVGAFVAKLRFKVKNGDMEEVNIRGHSQHARVKMFPDELDIGCVPFGIPCKRFILLVNPFMIPVALQFTVGEDGDEIPLVLNVNDADGLPVITVKDYISAMIAMAEEEFEPNAVEEPTVQLVSRSDSLLSYRSVSTEESTCSTYFEEEILEKIPDFAFTIIRKLRETRHLEQKEVEECVVSATLDVLLKTNYFNSLKQFANYAQMDWNIIPFNPKEIYCDKEIIYLQPNAGKTVTVLLIPNRVGLFNRALNVRICPITEEELNKKKTDFSWDLRDRFFVSSKMFTTKIWMEYACHLPIINFTQEINYESEETYIDDEVQCAMLFKNSFNVPGFFYYDVIPSDENGEMIFPENILKFFIPAFGKVVVHCTVIFRRLGKVKLSGLIKIVGNLNGSPFHIVADVKPVKIKVSATRVHRRQKVLETTAEHIYVTNDTPTVTRFTVKLKNSKHQYIEPRGAILSPEGQGTYITIFSKFYDAETYYNTLVISVANSNTIEIPLTYVVEGSPVGVEPDIFKGHDCGTLMINCLDRYESDVPKYTQEVKLTNNGKHRYCMYIDKLRNNVTKCAIELGHGHLTVSPKMICLEPQSQGTLYITADSCEAGVIFNEFRVRTIDQEHKLKVHTTRFTATATFMEPEIHWCQKLINMEYNRTHFYKEHPVLAIACLKNMVDVKCKVWLKIVGPFKIKHLFEHNFAKIIHFPMTGLEQKEIIISLNKSAIRDEFCSTVDGRILCEANNKYQRSLQLKLKIRSPELRIMQPDMILFTRENASLTYVELRNISCLNAQYKWKKVEERTAYVSEYDDTYKFSLDILSEILRTLDIDGSDSDEDSLYQRNLTLRYQKYRCRLHKIQDPIGVDAIINEIINNLDLEHKRYMLKVDDPYDPCLSARRCSSGEFVRKTLDSVLYGLKLEDSYDISQESMEECDSESTIHFIEKTGHISKFDTVQSALFLPPVKPGYAKTAIFVLDTVGSCPQQFDITLINLEKVMEFSSENVYLGIQPWYELFKTSVRIINVTQYPITLSISHKTVVDKSQRLSQGYAKIIGEKSFDICKFKSKLLTVEGLMGFSEQFTHDILVNANKSEEQTIHFRGQGIMPIIEVVTKLSRPEQEIGEILKEYELLQIIYHFDVFKSITEYDEDMPAPREEDNVSMITTKYSLSSYHTSSSKSTSSSREARFYRMMKTYVIINNNAELPHASVLEQLIETQKFIRQLRENPKSVALLRKVHQDYLKLISNYGESMPINLKHFTSQPLPFHQQGFVLNMNVLVLGQLRKFTIDLHFHGPGKLIAAVRTEVKIPGLYVDFEVKKSEDHEYLFYAAEKKSPSLFGKRYRNMYERVIDLETDPKVKHAHSFDLDKTEHHTRLEVGAKQRKELQNYYNSLNKSVYEDHRHHFTLCKIFSNSKTNYYSGEAHIVVLLKPEAKFYEEGQVLEDYLYVDLHLGPTLPILLRGIISKHYRKQSDSK
uniref:Hydrocephalus-inducing n=1 Tax=Bactrocera latifrons TaxID=174628 RepID=A0A0K8TXD1_BACLA